MGWLNRGSNRIESIASTNVRTTRFRQLEPRLFFTPKAKILSDHTEFTSNKRVQQENKACRSTYNDLKVSKFFTRLQRGGRLTKIPQTSRFELYKKIQIVNEKMYFEAEEPRNRLFAG